MRAVNPVGKGDWGRVQGRLAPGSDAGVRVSPVSVTVDEGDTFSYTVRLATEPPHPVLLITQPRGRDRYVESDVGGRFLIPAGWTHPERDWSSFAAEWDKGVTINHTAKEDGDAEDDATVIDMWVQEVDCGLLYVEDADKAQCQRDWKETVYRNPLRSQRAGDHQRRRLATAAPALDREQREAVMEAAIPDSWSPAVS